MKYITIKLDYGRIEENAKMAVELDKLVSNSGYFNYHVNNIPYVLTAYFSIKTDDKSIGKIKEIVSKYNASAITGKGFDELFHEGKRMYNFATIDSRNARENEKYELIYLTMQSITHFSSKKELQLKGYEWENELFRSQIFISYSWLDKAIIDNVVSNLDDAGLNVFIDSRSIDYGEKIIEGMIRGMKDSEVCIFFLSQGFKNSVMAKHELSTIWSDIIKGNKKWLIVKLDDINPEEVYYGLESYKYFEGDQLEIQSNMENLIEVIKAMMSKKKHLVSLYYSYCIHTINKNRPIILNVYWVFFFHHPRYPFVLKRAYFIDDKVMIIEKKNKKTIEKMYNIVIKLEYKSLYD